jgi:hypothetical protein
VARRFNFTLRAVPVFVAVAGLLFSVARGLFSDEDLITALDCGEGRRIVITGDSSWDFSRRFHYRVVDPGAPGTPPRSFHQSTNVNPQSSLVTADGGKLAGVVIDFVGGTERRNVVIVVNFTTGEAWPVSLEGASDQAGRERLRREFERLRLENRGLRLVVDD